MKTDENTDPDAPTWWMTAILGEPSGNHEHDMMREAATYRLDVAHTDLAMHLMDATRDRTSPETARIVSANLLVAAALKIQREHAPRAHGALLQSCAAQHPDLEAFRSEIVGELNSRSDQAAVAYGRMKALGVLSCVLAVFSGVLLGIILT